MSNIIEARLNRLISSKICEAENIEEYASELKSLAANLGDGDYFKEKERFFKALSDSTRLKIIKMLAKKEMCVCEVMVALDVTQTNASHHLNILERESIVKKKRKGKWIIYSLNIPEMPKLIDGFSI